MFIVYIFFIFEPHNFRIQMWTGLDGSVGWIRPADHQLMITVVYVEAKNPETWSEGTMPTLDHRLKFFSL